MATELCGTCNQIIRQGDETGIPCDCTPDNVDDIVIMARINLKQRKVIQKAINFKRCWELENYPWKPESNVDLEDMGARYQLFAALEELEKS